MCLHALITSARSPAYWIATAQHILYRFLFMEAATLAFLDFSDLGKITDLEIYTLFKIKMLKLPVSTVTQQLIRI